MGLVKARTLKTKQVSHPRKRVAVNSEAPSALAPTLLPALTPALSPALSPVELLARDLKPTDLRELRSAIEAGTVNLADPTLLQGLIQTIEDADAAQRSQLIDRLKSLSVNLSPLLSPLLAHADANLRIFAIGLLVFRRVPDVEQRLLEVIRKDEDLRVCASALDLICEVGTEAALLPLNHLKARFASDPYIQFAVNLAIKRIREV